MSTSTTTSPAPSTAGVIGGFSQLSLDGTASPTFPTSSLSLDEKLEKFAEIAGERLSVDTEAQLRTLLTTKEHPIAYDAIEPSGRVTLASGVLRALNAQRLVAAGCRVRLLVADTHAVLNNKFGGDVRKIQSVSAYIVEVWKALGLNAATHPQVDVLLASSEIARQPAAYWSRVLDVAGVVSVERAQQCASLMGRSLHEPAPNANRVLYPMMHVADGFLMDADIVQRGADAQDGVALVDEYATLKAAHAPVALLHPLLCGLKQEQRKMSASDAESAIYVDDSAAEVNVKIKKAYCPPGDVVQNPILDMMRSIVFPSMKEPVTIDRSEKNGGALTFATYAELETAFAAEQVHPADLKPCLSKYINALLEPVRQHFASGELKKLWTNVKKLKSSPLPDGDKLVTLPLPGFPATSPDRQWETSHLSLDERFAVSRSVGEECIQESELQLLLEKKPHPVCYDGFEPSGRMHIAQGVLRTVNVNKLTSAGAIFRFWVADWFAMLNNKMGGDLTKIQVVGRYMVEIWKSAGMDMTNVEFLWASNEILAHANAYWLRVIDIARRTTVARTLKCCTIMGRKEKEGMMASQILYPLMQCADIFSLQADICQLGMDQRKINMLARDYCDLIKLKFKPVVLSHHMLMGLKEGQEKMSKSDPESAIFMEDAVDDVNRKLHAAFCPDGVVEANPILDYFHHIIFARFQDAGVAVATTGGSGEKRVFKTYDALETAFVNREVTSDALKTSLATYLNEILEPVRVHFASGEPKELLEQVRSFRITR